MIFRRDSVLSSMFLMKSWSRKYHKMSSTSFARTWFIALGEEPCMSRRMIVGAEGTFEDQTPLDIIGRYVGDDAEE